MSHADNCKNILAKFDNVSKQLSETRALFPLAPKVPSARNSQPAKSAISMDDYIKAKKEMTDNTLQRLKETTPQ